MKNGVAAKLEIRQKANPLVFGTDGRRGSQVYSNVVGSPLHVLGYKGTLEMLKPPLISPVCSFTKGESSYLSWV